MEKSLRTRVEGQEQYTVAFDPLDGSSIISTNWTVGAIFGIWDGPTAIGQDPVEKQIGAVLGVLDLLCCCCGGFPCWCVEMLVRSR